MNPTITSACALALLASSGLAGVKCRTSTTTTTTVCAAPVVCFTEPDVCLKPLKTGGGCNDQYRAPYHVTYPGLCYFDKVYPSNTERALKMRQEAILRQREILCFEKRLREASPWNTDPASQGHVIPGSTDGAGMVPDECAPVPPTYPYPGPGCSVPVGEKDCPTAVRCPGRPDYVFCPFGTNYGCLCVKGLRSGSIVRDPFTRRYFRIP